MNAFLTFPAAELTDNAAYAADITVAGFGAKGGGKTDDGPAIRKPIRALYPGVFRERAGNFRQQIRPQITGSRRRGPLVAQAQRE